MSTHWRNRLTKAKFRPLARDRRARLGIEGLEQRLALTVTAVVVNGQLQVTGDGAADTITLDHSGANTIVVGKGSFADTSITHGIVINTGASDDTVNLLATVKPVTIDGQAGFENVNLGKNGNAQGIVGSVFVKHSGTSLTIVSVDDTADAAKRSIDISRNDATDIMTIAGLTPGTITYTDGGVNGVLRAGDGANTFTITGSDLSGNMVIAGGAGNDTFNIRRNGAVSISGRAGVNTFNLGLNGNTQGVGSLFINSQGGVSDITVDDSADTLPRNVRLETLPDFGPTLSGLTFNNDAIHFSQFDTRQLTVRGGSGGNTFAVADTAVPTTINAGTKADTVNVQGTSAPLDINGDAGLDTVNLGSNGSVQGIKKQVSIGGASKSIALNIDDSKDATARTVTIDSSLEITPEGVAFFQGTIKGSGGGDIIYLPIELRSLTVSGGTGGNIFTFSDTGPVVPTVVNTGTGQDKTFVFATSGPLTVNGITGSDTVNVGAGFRTNLIKGGLTVTNTGARTTLNIDDSGDTAPSNVSLTDAAALGKITGLAPAVTTYVQNDLKALNLSGGGAGNTFAVGDTFSSTFATIPTTINTGAGADTVNVQRTTQPLIINGQTGVDTVNLGLNGSVQGIKGAVSIIGEKTLGSVAVNVDDHSNGEKRVAELNTTILQGLGGLRLGGIVKDLAPAQIDFTLNLRDLRIRGGSGGNTFTVLDTPGNATLKPVTKLETGSGNDTVTVRRTTFPININTEGGANTVNLGNALNNTTGTILGSVSVASTGGSAVINVNDQGSNAGGADVTLASHTTAGILFGDIIGQLPGGALISYVAAQVSRLTINANPAGNRFSIDDAVAGTTVLNTGTGTDTVDINATSKPLTVNGQNGPDIVTVGKIGTVQSIKGAVTVTNSGSRSRLIADDSQDTTKRTATLGVDLVTGFGTITDLAPAAIKYFFSDVSAVTVNGGKAGNTFTVQDTVDSGAKPHTTLNSGTGLDTVNLQRTKGALTINGQNGRDIVNVGLNNSMQSIKGTLRITNAGNFSTINLNNQADTTAHSVTMGINPDDVGEGFIIGLAPFPTVIFYRTFDVSTLTVNTGSGADSFQVNNTASNGGGPANTIINSGGGPDTISVFGTTGPLTINAGAGNNIITIGSPVTTLDLIQGAVTVNRGADFDTLIVDDQASTSAHIYKITPTQVLRSGAAAIAYSSIEDLNVNRGPEPTGPLARDLAFPSSITAGEFATLTGRLVDPDGDVNLTLTVVWGDGSKPQTTSPGIEPFSLKHKFKKAGTYTVRVIWTDSTGQSNFRDLRLTVAPKHAKPGLVLAAKAHAGHRR